MSQPTPVAVVTGASSGIGQAIALEFARAGYCVLAHGHKNVDGLLDTRSQIESIYRDSSSIESPKLVWTQQADLSTPVGIERLFASAASWQNRLDVWVNAAGADVLTGEAPTMSFAQKLALLWAVDVQSTLLLSRMAAEFMQAQPSLVARKPAIINISWDQAERGMAGDSGQYFSAVKAAIAAFSRSLAMTVGPSVRVNCIAPGWIQTAWGDTASSHWQQRAVGESSLQRWGQRTDVAQAAVWLASPSAEFVNGQVIAVNGGWKPNYPDP